MLLGVIVRNKHAPVKRSRAGSDRVSSKTEPPSKRSSVDELSSKSSTPTTQTPVKPSDSPVDEIEDIVFHYHNTQGSKPEPAKPVQPSSFPPMISALLKIQEQEKRLRELQKQSELLEKELAPKTVASPVGAGQIAASSGIIAAQMQPSVSVPNLTTSQVGNVSSHLSGRMPAFTGSPKVSSSVPNLASGPSISLPSQVAGHAKGSKNLGFPAVIKSAIGSAGPVLSVDGPKTANVETFSAVGATANTSASIGGLAKPQADDDEPYDPETAENEETPYDPEDMDTIDISLDEVPSPDKGSTASSQPHTAAAQNAALFKAFNLGGQNIAGSLQQSALLTSVGKPDIRVDSLVKQVNNQPVLAPEIPGKSHQTINQHSIPKELEEKVQALLKSEQGNMVRNNYQAGKPEGPSQYGEPRLHHGGPERSGGGAYHHTRDFPEKFPERHDFSERRGYNEGREDPKFYSSRFSLNARRGSDERGGHDRGYERGYDREYDRDYRSREHRDGDRHWDDRGGRDERRRDEYFNRNRDRFQRDRNWRR